MYAIDVDHAVDLHLARRLAFFMGEARAKAASTPSLGKALRFL